MSSPITVAPPREAVILMSALVPTTGHRDLIRFAVHQPMDTLHVIIGYIPEEPVTAQERIDALRDAVERVEGAQHERLRFHALNEATAPSQADKAANVKKFFADWANLIINIVDGDGKDLYLIGSEEYCIPQAEAMGVAFIPYDMSRSAVNSAQGRVVRGDMLEHWSSLTPGMQRKFGLTATVFGREGVGKSSVTEGLGGNPLIATLPEYASQYFSTAGEMLTISKMEAVWHGQAAWERMAQPHAEHPMLAQDTDLFTVLGYYRAQGWDVPEQLFEDAAQTVSDIYFILPDRELVCGNDQFRYGGNAQMTTQEFWVRLCEEFSLKYVLVPEGSVAEKQRFIEDAMFNAVKRKQEPVRKFVRQNVDPTPTPPVQLAA